MIGWLWNKLVGEARGATAQLTKLLYAPLHVIYLLVHSVFGHVEHAWSDVYGRFWQFVHYLADAFTWTVNFATRLVVHDLPALLRWAEDAVGKASAFLTGVFDHLSAWILRQVGALLDAISGVVRWVLSTVYEPIVAALGDVKRKLTEWAFTAFTLVTHPSRLADILIMPLVDAVGRHAVDVGRKVGGFLLSTVLHHVSLVPQVIEAIISDIL